MQDFSMSYDPKKPDAKAHEDKAAVRSQEAVAVDMAAEKCAQLPRQFAKLISLCLMEDQIGSTCANFKELPDFWYDRDNKETPVNIEFTFRTQSRYTQLSHDETVSQLKHLLGSAFDVHGDEASSLVRISTKGITTDDIRQTIDDISRSIIKEKQPYSLAPIVLALGQTGARPGY